MKERIEALRQILADNNFAGYIVPTTDEYLSEYTPPYARRLEYITGFTGSNGIAIILPDSILFFTDGRYLEQAKKQLSPSLMSSSGPDEAIHIFDLQELASFDWAKYINSEEIIAYDPKLFTKHTLQYFSAIKTLQMHHQNLIDQIWQGQPAKPDSKIYDYPEKYAGQKYTQKIDQCRNFIKSEQAGALVINDSASVCWLLNIRAHDVEFSPLLLAHCIITQDKLYLFTDKSRFAQDLKRPEIEVVPEADFEKIILGLEGVILFDENQSSAYISDLISQGNHKAITNPCLLWKACKNSTEITHMKNGHVQDAVAVCEMLAFLSNNDPSSLTEYDIGEKLNRLRAGGKDYVFDSFATICGYQENAAIIHYRAEKETAKKITNSGLLLIDSGGQYWGATTDITRTLAIGKPKREHKKYYTKVLKGHIALANALFPEGKTTGAHLDVLARQYFWNAGEDYAHGTGHGVGSFLGVHEGPQNISIAGFGAKISEGMVMSNEPGYYVSGKFGIRIENMMYAKKAEQQGFLCFEMLTLVPYAKYLIDFEALTDEELGFIRSYYQQIKEQLAPLLSREAGEWLETECKI